MNLLSRALSALPLTALGAVLLPLAHFGAALASERPAPEVQASTESPSYLTRGPRSDSEAQILVEDATSDALSKKWGPAAIAAERFLARYPSHPRYAELLELRATALLQLGRPKEALPLWRAALQRAEHATSAPTARLRLARTYLELKRPAEARLLALRESRASGSIRTEAILLRGEADLRLGRVLDAEMALASAQTDLQTRRNARATGDAALSWTDASLEVQATALRLEIAWHRCGLVPSARALSEAQAIEQLTRRGTCLFEAALPRSTTVLAPYGAGGPTPSWLLLPPLDFEKRIQLGWTQAVREYQERCENPPLSLEKKTALEAKRYREELKQQLASVCGEKIQQIQEALTPRAPIHTPTPSVESHGTHSHD